MLLPQNTASKEDAPARVYSGPAQIEKTDLLPPLIYMVFPALKGADLGRQSPLGGD